MPHDRENMWCLDCDRVTEHAVHVLRCSTTEHVCQTCGRER